jgi:hypothetical protein
MTVRDLLTALQRLPRDAELLAFEAGCDDYCEREVDELELRAAGSTCTSAPGGTSHRGGSRDGAWPSWTPTRRRPCGASGAAVGFVEVLGLVDHHEAGQDKDDEEPLDPGSRRLVPRR